MLQGAIADVTGDGVPSLRARQCSYRRRGHHDLKAWGPRPSPQQDSGFARVSRKALGHALAAQASDSEADTFMLADALEQMKANTAMKLTLTSRPPGP